MSTTVGLVIAGCIGGLVPELIRIGKGPVDGIFKTPAYWLQLIAQIALGGVVAYFLSPGSPQEAFTYGFTAPQLATRIAAAPTPEEPTEPPLGGAGPRVFKPQVWWSR